jgi:hypothetical protein
VASGDLPIRSNVRGYLARADEESSFSLFPEVYHRAGLCGANNQIVIVHVLKVGHRLAANADTTTRRIMEHTIDSEYVKEMKFLMK